MAVVRVVMLVRSRARHRGERSGTASERQLELARAGGDVRHRPVRSSGPVLARTASREGPRCLELLAPRRRNRGRREQCRRLWNSKSPPGATPSLSHQSTTIASSPLIADRLTPGHQMLDPGDGTLPYADASFQVRHAVRAFVVVCSRCVQWTRCHLRAHAPRVLLPGVLPSACGSRRGRCELRPGQAIRGAVVAAASSGPACRTVAFRHAPRRKRPGVWVENFRYIKELHSVDMATPRSVMVQVTRAMTQWEHSARFDDWKACE